MSEWIACKDRLPESGQRVVVYEPESRRYFVATFWEDEYMWDTGDRLPSIEDNDHWLAMPDCPFIMSYKERMPPIIGKTILPPPPEPDK